MHLPRQLLFIGLCAVAAVHAGPLTLSLTIGATGSSFWGNGVLPDIRNLNERIDSLTSPAKTGPIYAPTVGLSASSVINKWLSVGVDLWYRCKGLTYSVADTAPQDSLIGVVGERSISIDYLTIPLRVFLYFPGYRLIFPYLYAGGYGGILLDVNQRTRGDRTVERYDRSYTVTGIESISLGDHIIWYDLGIVAGGGLELGMGLRGVNLDFGCEWGLVDVANRPRNDVLFSQPLRTLTFAVTVGYEMRFFSF